MNVTRVVKKYGFTIKQVEAELGYKESCLKNMLSRAGKAQCITTALLYKIADCVGCHPSEFLLDDPTTFKGNVIEHSIPIKQDKKPIGKPKLVIKQVMKEKGVTVKSIAELLGITETGLWFILKKNTISADRLFKIAEFLGVKVTDLFDYEE